MRLSLNAKGPLLSLASYACAFSGVPPIKKSARGLSIYSLARCEQMRKKYTPLHTFFYSLNIPVNTITLYLNTQTLPVNTKTLHFNRQTLLACSRSHLASLSFSDVPPIKKSAKGLSIYSLARCERMRKNEKKIVIDTSLKKYRKILFLILLVIFFLDVVLIISSI